MVGSTEHVAVNNNSINKIKSLSDFIRYDFMIVYDAIKKINLINNIIHQYFLFLWKFFGKDKKNIYFCNQIFAKI